MNNQQQSPRAIDIFHQYSGEEGLEYLIIGGLAASVHGRPRYTADIDFVIDSSNFGLATRVMQRMSYKIRHQTSAFAQFDPPVAYHPAIDFMLVNSDTWAKLLQKRTFADFGGTEPYPSVGALHLLAMKFHSAKQPDRKDRLKDCQDIAEVMFKQTISFEDLEKEGIIVKHANKETIDEVSRILAELNK
jgi:hypothetical protein